MLSSVEGIFKEGKIELVEIPSQVPNDTKVIVTFLDAKTIDLRARGINEKEAADLRHRLSTFVEDWDSPEMNMYDDYDQAKSKL